MRAQKRDFVLISHTEVEPNGTIQNISFTDNNYNHLVDEDKNVIRGVIHIQGWSLEALPKNRTKVTRVVEIDYKGSQPILNNPGNKDRGQ
jgi:hypothetical protein